MVSFRVINNLVKDVVGPTQRNVPSAQTIPEILSKVFFICFRILTLQISIALGASRCLYDDTDTMINIDCQMFSLK